MKARLALLTGGHLSTCPRILKSADALAEEGYEVAGGLDSSKRRRSDESPTGTGACLAPTPPDRRPRTETIFRAGIRPQTWTATGVGFLVTAQLRQMGSPSVPG
jgi:hypothetical protein